MFIEIEGNVLLNVDLVERVEMKTHQRKANVWIGSASLESEIVYRYFMAVRGDRSVVAEVPPLPEKV